MPSRRRVLPVLAPAALVLLALAGCGGGDAPSSATDAAARTETVTRTVTVPATTPTAPSAPADPAAPLTLAAAEQVLDARGYAALGERDWRPDQSLKVLPGVSRAADPRAELAFFFVGDRFIGTDAKDPSASIEVLDQDDDSVTLSYALYRPSDGVDGPSGGTAEVTFAWDGSRLAPQDPIPSADPDAPLSRR